MSDNLSDYLLTKSIQNDPVINYFDDQFNSQFNYNNQVEYLQENDFNYVIPFDEAPPVSNQLNRISQYIPPPRELDTPHFPPGFSIKVKHPKSNQNEEHPEVEILSLDGDVNDYDDANQETVQFVNTPEKSNLLKIKSVSKIVEPVELKNHANNKSSLANYHNSTTVNIQQLKIPGSKSINHRTKKHFCLYCHKLQSKISRHLEVRHRNRRDVKRFIRLRPGDPERKAIINDIRVRGDYLHNMDEKYNTGVLITSRQRQKKSKNTANDYLPCIYCSLFCSKKTLRAHVANCEKKRKGSEVSEFVFCNVDMVANDKPASDRIISTAGKSSTRLSNGDSVNGNSDQDLSICTKLPTLIELDVESAPKDLTHSIEIVPIRCPEPEKPREVAEVITISDDDDEESDDNDNEIADPNYVVEESNLIVLDDDSLDKSNSPSKSKHKLKASRSKELKRSNRRHFCFYCHTFQSKIARHLEVMHKSQPDVKKFINLPPGNIERKALIRDIRKRGDNLYNMNKELYKTEVDNKKSGSKTPEEVYLDEESNLETLDDDSLEDDDNPSVVNIKRLRVPRSKKISSVNKKHFCFYCHTLQSKIARHLEVVHKDEPDVEKFINLPPGTPERKALIDDLRIRGDYLHNMNREYNTGVLITSRQRQKKSKNTAKDYLPCRFCSLFCSKRNLRTHEAKCEKNQKVINRKVKLSKKDRSSKEVILEKRKVSDDNEEDLENIPGESSKEDHPLEVEVDDDDVDSIASTSIVNIQQLEVPRSKIINTTKKHCCLFCHKLQSKIARHVQIVHKDEPDVQKFIHLSPGDPNRKAIIDDIRVRGDYLHNISEKYNTGVLITSRQRQKESKNTAEDYLPCSHCSLFCSKKTIRMHVARCDKNRKKGERNVLTSSRVHFNFMHHKACELLRRVIFPVMRDDNVTRSIKYDELLVLYANKLCSKYPLDHQYDMIRARLRLLGRFKLAVKKISPDVTDFASILLTRQFTPAFKGLQVVAKWDDTIGVFKTPAVAISLSGLIKELTKKLLNDLIKMDNKKLEIKVNGFLQLWEDKIPPIIVKKASEDQITIKRNKIINLPSKNDIKLLYDYLRKEADIAYKLLLDKFNLPAWDLLNQTTLVLVQIFNRRPGCEIERLKLNDYANREMLSINANQDPYLSFDAIKYASQYVMIKPYKKSGKTVSILLNSYLVDYLNILIEYRNDAGITSDNDYLFANPKADSLRKKYITVCPSMKRFSFECGAQVPHSLTATTLRKYISDFTAMLEIEDSQSEKVNDFIDHDTYRIVIPVAEMTKVSSILVAAMGDSVVGDANDPMNPVIDDDECSDSDGESELMGISKETLNLLCTSDDENDQPASKNPSKLSNSTGKYSPVENVELKRRRLRSSVMRQQ